MDNNKYLQIPNKSDGVDKKFDFIALSEEKEIPGYRVDFIEDKKKKSNKRPTMYDSRSNKELVGSAARMILDSNVDYSVDDIDVSVGLGSNKPTTNVFAKKQDVVESAFRNSYDSMNTKSKRLSILFDLVNDDDRPVSSSYIDYVSGNQSEDASDDDMSKADALNRIAIASGDPVEAFNMYVKSGMIMDDRKDDYSEQGIISGFDANDLYSNLYVDTKRLAKNLVEDTNIASTMTDLIINNIERESDKKNNKPGSELIQNWLKNTPSGRYFNDLDIKRNDSHIKAIENLKNEIDKVRKNYDKKEYNVKDLIPNMKDNSYKSNMINMANVYLDRASNDINASRPKEGSGVDILTSFGRSAKADISDLFGFNSMMNDSREKLTQKLIDIDANDPFALTTYDGIRKVLTKEELILLKSFTTYEEVSAKRRDNKSVATDVGSGLYDSTRFIAEMWLGGKIASGAIGVMNKTLSSIKSIGSIASKSKLLSPASEFLMKDVKLKGKVGDWLMEESKVSIKGLGNVISKKGKDHLVSTASKFVKDLPEKVITGAFMPSTYTEPLKDNLVAEDYVYGDDGTKIASKLSYNKDTLSDFVSKAAENSLSAFVEGGGIIRPSLKVLSGILPEMKLIKGVYNGVNDVLKGGISAITNNGISKKLLSSKTYNAVSKLWDNDVAKSMKVGNPFEELFEEFEEPLLKGDDMTKFFNTRNLMVTAATVGLFSGAFAGIGVANYSKASSGAKQSEARLRTILQSSFGLSDEATNNYISILDNAPVESLGDHVNEIVSRVYSSVSDGKERGTESRKAIGESLKEFVSISASYAGNRARLNSITNAMSTNQEGKDEVIRTAIGQMEKESANKAVSSVVNETSGTINTVYALGLQKRAFLVSGATVDGSGNVVLNEDNQTGKVTIALPNSGKRIEVDFSKIHGQGEVHDVNQVSDEIASFNTNKYMDEMWSNPDGKIPGTKQSSNVKLGNYKGKSSVVSLSEESNEILNDKDLKSDTFMPNIKNPITGKNGTWVRLVKDDSTGTYDIVPVDTKVGSVINVDKDGNAIKETQSIESDIALDENRQKLIDNTKFSSSIFDDDEDAGDEIDEFVGEDEVADDSHNEDIEQSPKFVSLSERLNASSGKSVSDDRFDGMSKEDVVSSKAEKSIEDFLDTESGEVSSSEGSFTQKFIDDPDFEFESDPSELSFLARGIGSLKRAFKIRKLTRDKSGRRIDKNGDAFTRTLVFINKKREKTYNSDGTSAEKWVPFSNSSVLLDGSWYDGAEVSVSTMPLETIENGVKTITRAPIIIVSNKSVSDDELIFTMKSPRLLLAARNSGKITSHQYNRGVTMYNNLVNAVKTGIGSDIVIAIGKPKMSSFRMSSERNADGSKVIHPFRLLSDLNSSGISRIDPKDMNFCIRIDGMLFEFSSTSSELEEVPFVNNVGSRSGASISMVPPVIKNSDRDYTPMLGPVLNSDAAVTVVSEIIKADLKESVSNIIQAFGESALSQEDSFLLDTLVNSSMTVRDFMKLFVPNHDPSISNGVYMLGGVLYTNGNKIGRLSTLSVEEVANAIRGNALNVNLEVFFDDMLNQKSLSDVLKIDESIIGNDLHSFLYSIATSNLDFGLYDPPFLFIDEVDLSDESVSVVGDTEIVNTLDIPKETLEKINAIYNKRSKFADDHLGEELSHDEFIKMVNEANDMIGFKPIDFRVVESPNSGESAVANEMATLAIKWLAEKAFGHTVVTDKNEIKRVLNEIKEKSRNEDVRKLASGKVSGFVIDNVVYLNDIGNITSGHELAHLLLDAMEKVLSKSEYDDIHKNIVAFGNQYPDKIKSIENRYGTGGDKYVEFFCDEFGARFDEHINEDNHTNGENSFFMKVAVKVFTFIVNTLSKLHGTTGAKFKAMSYNMIVRYAFKASISDFIFINNIFNSNRELMERVSLISMFSKNNKFNYGVIDSNLRSDINEARFSKKSSKKGTYAGKKYKSNLSYRDQEIVSSKSFNDHFSGSVILDDNDEPLKLYINHDEGLLTDLPVLSDKKIDGQSESGFLVAKNVFHITDRNIIRQLYEDPQSFGYKFFNDIRNANGIKYDTVSFRYGDRTIYIPMNIDSFSSTATSRYNSIMGIYKRQKGYRLNKALKMLEQGHKAGSVAAATGLYVQSFSNGTTAVSEVKFSDEDVILSNVKKAIESGDEVKLSSLYMNSELLALTTNPNLKVKILESDGMTVSDYDFVGDTVVVRVHSGVNKNDYKHIFRDLLFGIIEKGNTLNKYRPIHIVAHVENQKKYNLMNYGNSGKIIDALNESKHKAIEMWESIVKTSGDTEFLDKQRKRILSETGWYVINSKYMISGGMVDAINMRSKIVDMFNDKSFRNSFDARSVLNDFIADILPSTLVEVKYVEDDYKKYGDYDETSNTITIYIKKSKLDAIKTNSDDVYINSIVNTIIHEVTHAIQYNISLDSVGGNKDSLYGLANVDIATAKTIHDRAVIELDDAMQILEGFRKNADNSNNASKISDAAVSVVSSELAIKMSRLTGNIDSKVIALAVENAISDYKFIAGEYGIVVADNIRSKIEKNILLSILDVNGSLYVKSSSEASAFILDEVFLNPIFRDLDQMVIDNKYGVDMEKLIVGNEELYNELTSDEDTSDRKKIFVKFSAGLKEDVDASTAYNAITANIMHELAESIINERSINIISERVLNEYLEEFNITGGLDIFSMVKQFISDLKASTKTTITDYASFVNFMPFEHGGIKSIMDVKKFKDYMMSLISKMNNIDDFISTVNNLSKAGDPFAISIIRMDKICSSQGISNYYERLFAYYNQRKMVYVDADGINRTEIQLAIKTLSTIKRINEIRSTITDSFINSSYNEAMNTLDAFGDSEAIVLFFEKLGYTVSEWAASEYAKKTVIPVSTMLSEWKSELLSKDDKISSNSSIGIAIRDISIINNTSGTAAVVTNGNSYPAVDRYNAIFKSISDIIDMSKLDIYELEKANPYMENSIILNSIKNGSTIEIVKQVDEFSDLGDSVLSDILMVLNGNITLGKISTDGTRYYVTGNSLLPIMININSDNDIDAAYEKDGTVIERVSNVKRMSHSMNFNSKSQAGLRTISIFNGYALAEIKSIIKAYSKYINADSDLSIGYHILRNGDPGHGCKFSEFMNGVSISISIDGSESKMNGDLNSILDDLEKQVSAGNISIDNIKDIVPLRDSYSNDSSGELNYNAAMSISNEINNELDRAIDSSIADDRMIAMYAIYKTLIKSDVDLTGMSKHIANDAKLILENTTDIEDKMKSAGIIEKDTAFDVIATALLMKRISLIEASKAIFGNPQEYGSIVKQEKRTQSFNTTGTIPVLYSELNQRPNGDEISPEFDGNKFRCEFTGDLSKNDPQFYDNVSDTPGSVMISIHMYREILIRSRGWSDEFEAEYKKAIDAYNNGSVYDDNKSSIKFNPLKLIYVGYRYDADGQRHRTMIKAQFVPLLSDMDNNFNGMLDKFMDSDVNKRLHMVAMEDSVKLGFFDGSTTLDFSDLLTISVPRYSKKNMIPIIRKLLLFNDSNFNASIENEASDILDEVLNDIIDSDGLINLDSIRPNGSSQDDADLNAAIDLINKMRNEDQSINPLDYACMFEPVTNAINNRIKDIFEFKMKGIQCSAVTERFFTNKRLNFINDEGSMDIMVPMEYFGDIVEGLSYSKAVEKLEKLGYINGSNSDSVIVRNPAQSNASISPAKIVGVFPRSYGHYISTPSEFLNANGGDYDGDKYFLFPVNQKNSPSANKAIFDMLMEERKTMSGNVDQETKDFEDTYSNVRSAYGMESADESANKDGRFFYDSYVSEISGLGLVGLCTNMISGLLSYVRNDTTYMHGNKIVVRTADEIAESLSTTSALFSFAVDIATKPLLQNAGITPAKFKLLFAVAAIADRETAIKFMLSNLIELKADKTSGNYDFGLYTNKDNILNIVNRSLKISNLNGKETDDEREEREKEEATFINTISRFSSIFSALKHSDDFYDYLRKSSYFDGIIQAEKVTELVNSITSANPNVLSFTASGFKSAGIKNARTKIDTISDVLSNSSIFYNSDVIKSIYEGIILSNREEQNQIDFDDPFQQYKSYRKDSSIYNEFEAKVIMKKILAYVSYKIGEQFISSNYTKQDVASIKKYMIDTFGISFSFQGGYIHSVTSTPDKLLQISRKYGDDPKVADFFRLYYASASQRDYLRELNKDIKKAKENADYDLNPELSNFANLNDYHKLPGAVLSLYDSVRYGVYVDGANTTTSKIDMRNIFAKSKRKDLKERIGNISNIDSEKVRSIISSIRTISNVNNGLSSFTISIPSIESFSGNMFDSSQRIKLVINGLFNNEELSLMKDLASSILLRLPIINTNLSDSAISAVLDSISRYNADNGDSINVHFLDSTGNFARSMYSGSHHTYSGLMSDAVDGSIIISRNIRNVSGYSEGDLSINDILESTGSILINIRRNVGESASTISVNSSSINPDAHVDYSIDNIESIISDMKDMTPVFYRYNADIVVGSTVSFKKVSDGPIKYKQYYGSVKSIDISEDGVVMYTIIANGKSVFVSEFSHDVKNIDLNTALRSGFNNLLIFTGNTSDIDAKKLSGLDKFYIIEFKNGAGDYVSNSITKEEDNNLNCTI